MKEIKSKMYTRFAHRNFFFFFVFVYLIESITYDIARDQTKLNQFVDELQAPIGDNGNKNVVMLAVMFFNVTKKCVFFYFLCNV